MASNTPLEQVIHYHQQTKHHLFRYARALGYLDWANQPNPFRRYDGAPLLRLPILDAGEEPVSPLYQNLYLPSRVVPVPVTVRSTSRFLEYALSITAWKQAGDTKWALRSNPSSGNLHPTEGYVLTGPICGGKTDQEFPAGAYHYASKEHALEQRVGYSPELFAALMKDFPPQAFLVGLSSIHWREAWKYGERAFRYCQHDVGHAIGTLRIAAAALGWRLVLLDGASDETIEWLLGLNRPADFEGAEREYPDLVAVIWPDPHPVSYSVPLCLDSKAVYELVQESLARWSGKANRLSADDPVPWEIIDEVAVAARKSSSERRSAEFLLADSMTANANGVGNEAVSASQIIHQRRSALAFDGKTGIPMAGFYTMLQRVMPRVELDLALRPMPWDAVPWDPTVHLALFVHRVQGVAPGLYMLLRNPVKFESLQKTMHPQFAWVKPAGCPDDLPLYLLEEGNAQRLAAQVSCHQDIAADGAFSLGMIAEFTPALSLHGPWMYRRLFWETGLIGQLLYLEAEAAGVRATGIGCFFDDPVHEVFGYKDMEFQSLYHFTTGGPVEDSRLTTLPPYGDVVKEDPRGMDLP